MKKLKSLAEEMNINLSDEQIRQFEIYYEMLIEKNKVMNLTAITEKEEVITKHFIDSISLLKYTSLHDKNILDIGTGAGFPGIPLKIANPTLSITLLDSLNKRINFLNEVIEELSLENVKTIHGRAEDFAHDIEYRGKYDYVVSRAVANLSTLSEYCLPFVKVGGYFVSYKSGNIDDELKNSKNAIFLCGGKWKKLEKFNLVNSDMERTFVYIEKVKNTAKMYPRKSGLPSKKPL